MKAFLIMLVLAVQVVSQDDYDEYYDEGGYDDVDYEDYNDPSYYDDDFLDEN